MQSRFCTHYIYKALKKKSLIIGCNELHHIIYIHVREEVVF